MDKLIRISSGVPNAARNPTRFNNVYTFKVSFRGAAEESAPLVFRAIQTFFSRLAETPHLDPPPMMGLLSTPSLSPASQDSSQGWAPRKLIENEINQVAGGAATNFCRAAHGVTPDRQRIKKEDPSTAVLPCEGPRLRAPQVRRTQLLFAYLNAVYPNAIRLY